jgi:hypothetical protein
MRVLATDTRLERIVQLLLSLNVAWIAVAYELWRINSVINQSGSWEIWRRYWHTISDEPYGAMEQVLWAVVLATLIFLFLRLARRTSGHLDAHSAPSPG